MTQRVVMAEYAIKAGPIEVNALEEAAKATVRVDVQLVARVTALEAELAATQRLLMATFAQPRESR